MSVLPSEDTLTEIFSEMTRYPRDLLSPDASLEDDLGIDSVKLGEILSVIRQRYELPESLTVQPEDLRTIRTIAHRLSGYLAAAGSAAERGDAGAWAGPVVVDTVAGGGTPSAAPNMTLPSAAELYGQLRAIFETATRYPAELFTAEASLEDDLGIDSVKLGEVLSIVRAKYHLPDELNVTAEDLRSLGSISRLLANRLAALAPAGEPSPAEAPPPERVAARNTTHSSSVLERTAPLPSLKGKVVFVSGSGRGLGRELALFLASRGASVVINSFHSRPRGEETRAEAEALGVKAIHAWGSMAKPEHVREIFGRIRDEFGRLDAFISNASNGILAPLGEVSPEQWVTAFKTNVIGLHQAAYEAAGLMAGNEGGGRIVTMSSPASAGNVDFFGCMGTVKAAVESLTKRLAVDLAPRGIQVNCVSAGPVSGELVKDKWPGKERLVALWESATPLENRLCEPADVCELVLFLLEPRSRFVTGATFVVDGGISATGYFGDRAPPASSNGFHALDGGAVRVGGRT